MFGYTIIKKSELRALKARASEADMFERAADRYRNLHHAASTELAEWERYGQRRSPVTGRLIPRDKRPEPQS